MTKPDKPSKGHPDFFRSAAIKSAQRHPRVHKFFGYLGLLLLGMFLVVFLIDPLTTSKGVFLSSVFALLLIGVFTLALTKAKSPGLAIVVILLAGWLVLMNHQFKEYIPLKDEALSLMNKNQASAMGCVQKGENLSNRGPITNRGRIFGDKDVPRQGSNLCPQIGDWEYLPQGWEYNPAPIEDLTASDGTFTFSARSRWQESVTCTELGCKYEITD